MHSIAGEPILIAWERSRELPEHEAVLAALALALPGRPAEELAALPLGERNALLLELRALTFGRRMEGFAVCPDCSAQLEFMVDPRQLAQGLRAELAQDRDGYSMRPLNSLDLAAGSRSESEERARSVLLARSLGIAEEELDELDDSTAALLERFERVNAAAEIRVALECAACGSHPLLDLDMARFFLREIAAAARRLMSEIHQLAGAYGWSESSIAGLSPARRSAYLEMLQL